MFLNKSETGIIEIICNRVYCRKTFTGKHNFSERRNNSPEGCKKWIKNVGNLNTLLLRN
jgi:hypothetical protein